MKAVILAGGLGQRLSPLTDPLTKVTLPVYDKPMIVHVVELLVNGGVTDIFVALDGRHPELVLEMLQDGSDLSCTIHYGYLKETRGPLSTLLLAEKWVGDEDFVLIFGDSFFSVPLTFSNLSVPHMFVTVLDGLDEQEKYSQVTLDSGKVTSILYKSSSRGTGVIQTMCFILPADAFAKARTLILTDPRATSLPTAYIHEGRMNYTMLPPQSYIDCGTITALYKAAAIRMSLISS